MADQVCGTCVHFNGNETGQEGECRRYPPQPLFVVKPMESEITSVLPGVRATFWCGEWRADARP